MQKINDIISRMSSVEYDTVIMHNVYECLYGLCLLEQSGGPEITNFPFKRSVPFVLPRSGNPTVIIRRYFNKLKQSYNEIKQAKRPVPHKAIEVCLFFVEY